jgi:hypothetical protein
MVEELAQIENPFGPVRRQEISVLFVDLVGFTTYAEVHPPEQVVDLLREFHRRMGDIVLANGGTVDSFIGDCLMATFGVPRATGREALTALHCAREMRGLDLEPLGWPPAAGRRRPHRRAPDPSSWVRSAASAPCRSPSSETRRTWRIGCRG